MTTPDSHIGSHYQHRLSDQVSANTYYGFLGNRYREQKLARCRQLLAVPQPPVSEETRDDRDQYEKITGASLIECPACHRGRMVVIDVFNPAKLSSSLCDTS